MLIIVAHMSSVNTMFGKSDTPVKFYHRGKRISVDTAFGMYRNACQFGSNYVLTVSGLPITNKVDKLTKVLEKRLAPGTVAVGRNGSMSNGRAQVTFVVPAAAARAQKKFDGFRLDKKHQLVVSGPNVPTNRNLPNNALFQRLQGRIAQLAARPQRSDLLAQIRKGKQKQPDLSHYDFDDYYDIGDSVKFDRYDFGL